MNTSPFSNFNMNGPMNIMSMNQMPMLPNFPMSNNFMQSNGNISNNITIRELSIISEYILYIQECILNELGDNYLSNLNDIIIKEIINHISIYFNLKEIDKNDMNKFMNMFEIIDQIFAKINAVIYSFLNSLDQLANFELSNKKDYKDMYINFINNFHIMKNDLCLILDKLNQYIANLQKSFLKLFENKNKIRDLSVLIKRILNEIRGIMNFNNCMQINNFNMTNQMNNWSINQNSNLMMPMQNQMNNWPINQNSNLMMPMQNQMYNWPINQNSNLMMQMQYQFNPPNVINAFNNNSLSNNNEEVNKFYIIKSTIYNFLKDLESLNKNAYIEGGEYFEPIEVNKENNQIINKISSKVFKYIEMDEKQNKNNLETEGKFLYSIGGIARKSLDIANRLYSKLFEEYKRYLKDPTKINRNQLDKKNLSRWVKNRFNVKEFIKNAAENHKQAIFKYNQYLVHKNDTDFLFEIFYDFLSLFLKCSLSIPMVEVKFLDDNNIIEKISKKVFNYIKLDEEQKKKDLEIEGKFLYSIGGVARISLNISNKLYSEIFQKYKIYLNDPRKINGNRLDNKNLSCWAKNSFNLKEFIQNSAVKYGNEISRYYKFLKYQEDRYFLFEIFNDFLSLFLKCSLSIPLVEVKFLDDKNILDKPIDNQEMIDLIIKNRIYKVNFCFLPQLTSNDGLIPGAKFHVFTYNEPETYKHPVIDYEIVRQKTELDY